MKTKRLLPLLPVALLLSACLPATPIPAPDRAERVPAHKVTPEEDAWPPQVAAGWSQPVPLPYPVNTSGGEDSPFLMPDGQGLYFFFTPDVSKPAQEQLFDGLTGIWFTHRSGETWSEPERVLLADPGELALDGCEFVTEQLMYFCTIRTGYTEIQWFRADMVDGLWQGWYDASEELRQDEYEVGELHISADGQALYFHSKRSGGYGGLDIWVSGLMPGGWSEPANLGPTVNTPNDEGWPYISPDEQELWFTGQSTKGQPGPAIFHSQRQPDGSWGQAEEIVSSFAGEPTLSEDGRSLYFVHHYFNADVTQMLEADIYVTTRP
jgi:hypothetical protein